MEFHPQDLLHDRYVLKELLGRGSFGEVWLAYDNIAEIDVALKIYIALDRRGLADFQGEYRSVYDLEHPNLLKPTHIAVWNNQPYLVMHYCPVSCESLIGRLSEDEIWKFISDVSSGLTYLHNQDIIHRDIKPDNILRDTQGRYVLTDFGLSKKLRASLRRNSTRAHQEDVSGALSYMGPELFESKPEAVKATDIWALGVTIYEMLVGELPFMGQGGVMQKNGADIPELPDEYSYGLRKLVHDCLQKNPWDRPMASQLAGYRGIKEPRPKEPWIKRLWKSKAFRITLFSPFIVYILWITSSIVYEAYESWRWEVRMNRDTTLNDSIRELEDRRFKDSMENLRTIDSMLLTPIPSNHVHVSRSVENYRVLNSEGVLLYKYTGELLGGAPRGHGKALYPDGRVYEGDFVNGKRHGDNARFVFSDGNVYEGSFVDDFIGTGRLTSKQQDSFGTYFDGTFKDDKPYKGTWFDKSGKKIKELNPPDTDERIF